MPRFGKPDPTGRSSGKRTGQNKKYRNPPKDQPWCWLTWELLESPAWRLRSINLARLIDFLLVEGMNHAGTENGNLKALYDQLVAFGLTRSEIHTAIEEGEFVGLLRCRAGGRWAGTNQPSTYRLTFYADMNGNPATNEWKGKTEDAIKEWKRAKARERRTRNEYRKKTRSIEKKQIPSSTFRTTVVRLPEL